MIWSDIHLIVPNIYCISTSNSLINLSMDNINKGGKSSLKNSPSVMACDSACDPGSVECVHFQLKYPCVSGQLFCSVWSWNGFPCHPECGPWPPPSPALQAWSWLAWSQGLVLGWVCVCGHPCAHRCVCRLRNCLLPAWPVRRGTEMYPPLAPARPHEWLTALNHVHCASGPLLPWRQGLVTFGWLPW